MAITLQCPRCMHEQRIDDDKVGKEVPCKICHHTIKAPAGAVVSKSAPKEKEAKQEGVKAGPPVVQAAAPTAVKVVASGNKSKPSKLSDDEPEKTRKKSKERGEDDEKRRPSSRNRRDKENSTSSVPMLLVIGGGILMVMLLCGGAGVGGYFALRSGKAEEAIARNNDPPFREDGNNDHNHNDAHPDQGQQQPPFRDPPNFEPPFRVPPPVQEESLNPNDPKQIDRVLKILRGPAPDRQQAFGWLRGANPEIPKRSEVAVLLEGMVDQEVRQPFTAFFEAYFRWYTKDNVPSLIRFAESTEFSPGGNSRRQQSMLALGKLKEAKAAENMASKLSNAFDWGAANEALTEMGPVAESVVLRYFNDPNGGVRDRARKLLDGYGAKPEKYLTQSIADLDSADGNRRNAALQWIAKSPVDPKRQADVAKLLNKSMVNGDSLRNGDLVTALENWGTSENVPKLVQFVESSQFGNGAAVRLLGKNRDPDSIKAVARALANFFMQGEAKNALKEIGPAAEPALIEAMNATKDGRARGEYVRMLGEIGTPKISGAALRQLAMQFQNDRFLGMAIQQSLLAIDARNK